MAAETSDIGLVAFTNNRRTAPMRLLHRPRDVHRALRFRQKPSRPLYDVPRVLEGYLVLRAGHGIGGTWVAGCRIAREPHGFLLDCVGERRVGVACEEPSQVAYVRVVGCPFQKNGLDRLLGSLMSRCTKVFQIHPIQKVRSLG